MNELLTIFSYPFMMRALLVGLPVALCSALLGVSLVLKRYSMIGDGLSHVTFGALAVAAALGFSPLPVALPVVALAAVALLFASERGLLKGDAAIAVISTSSLALGVFVTSKAGSNIDLSGYMFGSILSISRQDTILCAVLAVIILILYTLFYPRLFAVTFDNAFARATGIKTTLFNTLLSVLTALTVVLGMRLMGTLLISSLIIFPPLSAMRVCRTYKGVIITAGVLSVISFLIGLIGSFLLNAPTGASIVLTGLFILIICMIIGLLRNRCRHDT